MLADDILTFADIPVEEAMDDDEKEIILLLKKFGNWYIIIMILIYERVRFLQILLPKLLCFACFMHIGCYVVPRIPL